MLLIEKLVKLLDDFHYHHYREYVKNVSKRSYYPLALIDVIDRAPGVKQDSNYLCRAVYGEDEVDEKALKKFFQLAYHTFGLTHFLARNYPGYLVHNITRIQELINSGKLTKATALALMLKDVAEKIEDWDTLEKVLGILAQRAILLESANEALQYYEESKKIIRLKQDLNTLNLFIYEQYRDKGKSRSDVDPATNLSFFQPYFSSESLVVRTMSKLHYYYSLHLLRDKSFYESSTFEELTRLEQELQKNNYVIFPYLANLLPKLSFLKMMYSFKRLTEDVLLKEAGELQENSKDDLFWNSFINLPEINSIAIQTSHLVTSFFTSFRDDHLELLPEEVHQQIVQLRKRCREILDNELLEQIFTTKYINLTTIYAGLLLLGNKSHIKEAILLLEGLLVAYQQLSFHAFIDSIYMNLIMAAFCLKDYEKLEKYYRRYRKSTKDKVVIPENDFAVHLFYYASKWIQTDRKQYANKIEKMMKENPRVLNSFDSHKMLTDIINYYKIPVGLEYLRKTQ